MTIYVSHSTAFNFSDELYQPLRNSELALSHQFIFPHAAGSDQYPSKKLFADNACDLILAEITFPSTGQGIELGWADFKGIKIVCAYKDGVKVSDSLKTVAKTFLVYKNSEDLIVKLAAYLNL